MPTERKISQPWRFVARGDVDPSQTPSPEEWLEIYKTAAETKIGEARHFAATGNIFWALRLEKEADEAAKLVGIPQPALSTTELQAMYRIATETKFGKAQSCAAQGDVYWALRLEKEAGEAASQADVPQPKLSMVEKHTMYKTAVKIRFGNA
jgi:hypothetical protein